MKNKRLIVVSLIALMLFSLTTGLQAKATEPFRLEADVIDYNSKTGQMVASGASGVKLIKGTLTLTGLKADYNSKTQAGIVTGSVKGIQDNMTLTADQVESLEGNTHMIATGDVVLVNDSDRLTAPKVDYFSDRQLAVVEQDAKLFTADGTITSDRLETFFQEKRSVAEGNVRINSEQRKLQARSDHAVYYGAKPGEQGKIVLTGNAHAVQDGNTIVGQTLTLYMDDKAVDATGRTKIVIAPASK
jgi:lipopolysaccharide export system protein LptA